VPDSWAAAQPVPLHGAQHAKALTVTTPASYKLDTCEKDGGAEQYSQSSHNDLPNCLATWLNSASQ